MKLALLEFERNGYHDSDFYYVFFDTETKKIGRHMFGSTAFAGGNDGDVVRPGAQADAVWTPDLLEEARVALEEVIFSAIREAEHRDVLTPDDAQYGTVLRVTKDSSPRCKIPYKAGQTGEVLSCDAFGTFYRKGYNRPSRENRRVCLRLLDGSRVFVPLKYCRLDREPMGDDELRGRARELSFAYNFGAAVEGFTWSSREFFSRPTPALAHCA